MSEILEKNKKTIIIVLVMILISVALIVIQVVMKKSNESKELENKLTNLGIAYYEEIYYPTLDENTLKMYNENGGYRINLTNLINNIYVKDPGDFMDNKCNYQSSYVLIIPKSPYTKKDYDIQVKLECE